MTHKRNSMTVSEVQSENCTIGEMQTGRWSEEEHEKYLEGVNLYSKDYLKLADFIGSRSVIQIMSHAQKTDKRTCRAPKGQGKRRCKIHQDKGGLAEYRALIN